MLTHLYYQQRFPLLLFTIPVIFTLIGGFLALRLRRHMHLLIAVGAGLLLGASFLDLLPEAIGLGITSGYTTTDVLGLMLLSFFIFHGLEAGFDHLAARFRTSNNSRRILGRTGAGMLVFHSFRDGMAIGATYAVSHSAGYAIAFGIAAHDLGDGMNTVILATGGESPSRTDYLFLAADALAPFVGAVLTSWWIVSAHSSVILLVLAAGFFLHMATSEFLPEIRSCEGSRRYLFPAVLGGSLIIYVANILIARHL